jgi:Flp pilus assembly pilin Flp
LDTLGYLGRSAMVRRLWIEDEGVLTLEWILLTTLVVLGVIGGLAAVRDALVHELAGIVGATMSLDQSYEISSPIGISVNDGAGDCSTSVAGGAGSSSQEFYNPGGGGGIIGYDPNTGEPIYAPNGALSPLYGGYAEARIRVPNNGENGYTAQNDDLQGGGGCDVTSVIGQ